MATIRLESLERLSRKASLAEAKRSVLRANLGEFKDHLQALEKKSLDVEKAREVIILVGKQIQKNLEYKIGNIVTMALAAVFPDPYEFRILFQERRNTTEADLVLVRGENQFSPLDSTGGGVVDIVSFALRIADWKIRGGRNVLILDEPFRNLSADLQPKASEMMKRLSTELRLQIIAVSHQEGINECCDRRFTIRNGKVEKEK